MNLRRGSHAWTRDSRARVVPQRDVDDDSVFFFEFFKRVVECRRRVFFRLASLKKTRALVGGFLGERLEDVFPSREVRAGDQRDVPLAHRVALHLLAQPVRARRVARHQQEPADVLVQPVHGQKAAEVRTRRRQQTEHGVLPVLPRRVHGDGGGFVNGHHRVRHRQNSHRVVQRRRLVPVQEVPHALAGAQGPKRRDFFCRLARVRPDQIFRERRRRSTRDGFNHVYRLFLLFVMSLFFMPRMAPFARLIGNDAFF